MTLQQYNDLFKLPLLKKMTITSSGGVTITNENIVGEKMSLEKTLSSVENRGKTFNVILDVFF